MALPKHNLPGRCCAVIAALLLMLWAAGPFFLNAAAVSSSNSSGVMVTNGRIEATFSEIADVELMIDSPRPGSERLSIGDNLYSSSRPLLDGPGRPSHGAIVWFPLRGEWSLFPGASSWSNIRTIVRIPFWCIGAPFALVAFVTERRHRRWLRQERLGKCWKCGYDRVGLPAGARCPECGKR